jgi:hypothetical protein
MEHQGNIHGVLLVLFETWWKDQDYTLLLWLGKFVDQELDWVLWSVLDQGLHHITEDIVYFLLLEVLLETLLEIKFLLRDRGCNNKN